jgi:uncharacterized protein
MADVADVTTKEKGRVLLCPSCGVDLVMSERQGIEIDYCPKCRGVWLDRGELDKIVKRSQAEAGRYGHHGSGHGSYGDKQGHRRRSWLREIFD